MDDNNTVIHGLQRYTQIFLLCFMKKENQKNALSLVIEWNTFINESLNYERKNTKKKSTRNNMYPSTSLLPKYNDIQ
jgi:hypothetical protein